MRLPVVGKLDRDRVGRLPPARAGLPRLDRCQRRPVQRYFGRRLQDLREFPNWVNEPAKASNAANASQAALIAPALPSN